MRFIQKLEPRHIFLTIAGSYCIGYFAHALYLGKTVYGDGLYYYAWLTLAPSKYTVGPAVFWTPIYLVTKNEIAVGLVSVLASIFSLILLYNLLCKTFSKTVSLMAIAAIAGSTNLLFYGSLDAVNSHALSFFAVTVFLSLLVTKHWLAIGMALGIVGLMRTQDLLIGLLLLPVIRQKNILKIGAGFVLAFAPQLVAWHLVTGKFWLSPYISGTEGFNLLRPHILEILFNPQNGLVLWTPMVFLGLVGLLLAKRYRFLLVFIVQLYIVSSWSTWWQGASYSGRMFVSALPIVAFGIAEVFQRLRTYRFTQAHYLLTIIIPLTLLNMIGIVYFLITLS